jgi:hypothetical protein
MRLSSGRRLFYRRSRTALQRQELRTILLLRKAVTFSLLALFAVNVLSVISVVFLVGFGKMALSEKLIFMLIAETVAQAAAIFITITRFLFSK